MVQKRKRFTTAVSINFPFASELVPKNIFQISLNFFMMFCFIPKPLKQHPFSSKVSENELYQKTSSSLLLLLRLGVFGESLLSKFELENINTHDVPQRGKTWSIFNLVFQNTQLCDFLSYYIPCLLQTALSLLLLLYPLPGYGKWGGLEPAQSLDSSERPVNCSSEMPPAQACAFT